MGRLLVLQRSIQSRFIIFWWRGQECVWWWRGGWFFVVVVGRGEVPCLISASAVPAVIVRIRQTLKADSPVLVGAAKEQVQFSSTDSTAV